MPLYFFHLRAHEEFHEDEEGIDLPDVQAALEEALRVDRELRAEPVGLYGLELAIADTDGQVLLKVPVQERRRSRSAAPDASADSWGRRSTDKPRLLH